MTQSIDHAPTCRHCAAKLGTPILDLGFAPPSNAYLTADDLSRAEITYPLRIRVCPTCFLVQTDDFAKSEDLFNRDYAYFSSTSQGWLNHAREYCGMITDRFGLSADSFVIEIASNDGYLLRNFCAAGIPCLGIEPTHSTAAAAIHIGVPTLQVFFGKALAQNLQARGQQADLIVGNNVYAHVPDINDFTQGLAVALKPHGVVTLEFPHVLQLLQHNQFDTVYHEHFSYLSLLTVQRIFGMAGLRIFDVQHLPTHGGSLRVFGCLDGAEHVQTDAVADTLDQELAAGLDTLAGYDGLQGRAFAAKCGLLDFLLQAQKDGKSVAAYGAAAKGNTLLNFAGVRADLLPFVCDAAAAKQGKFMPGSHIPILGPQALRDNRPDYVIILPWNIAAEVKAQLADLAAAGTQFRAAIPTMRQI
jgi:hypothetical protein